MEEYIGTVIKAGGIVIGCVMVLFVIWYIVKDILDISEKIHPTANRRGTVKTAPHYCREPRNQHQPAV